MRMDFAMKWLIDLSAGKIQLVSSDWSNNTVAIDVEMDGSVLLRYWGCLSLLNWAEALILSLLLKLTP